MPALGASTTRIAPGRIVASAGVPLSEMVVMILAVWVGCLPVRASPLMLNSVRSDARLTLRSAATRGARSLPWAEAEKKAARNPPALIWAAVVAAKTSGL